jgi:hypothetical protein
MYKVVRVDDDGLMWSATIYSQHKDMKGFERLCLQYTAGEWTVPNVGRLMLFTNLEHAVNFMPGGRQSKRYQVWTCEAEDVRYENSVVRLGWLIYSCERFWKGELGLLDWMDMCTSAPLGSHSCSRLKLLERVPLG